MSSEAARIVGARLRSKRERLGASQQDIALSAGMNVAHLGRIERGQTNPTLETLVRLAAEVELTIADLVADIGRDDVEPLPRPDTYLEFRRRREAG